MAARGAYSAEVAAEIHRLFTALPIAVKRASDVLQQSPTLTPTYLALYNEVSQILTRINELTNR